MKKWRMEGRTEKGKKDKGVGMKKEKKGRIKEMEERKKARKEGIVRVDFVDFFHLLSLALRLLQETVCVSREEKRLSGATPLGESCVVNDGSMLGREGLVNPCRCYLTRGVHYIKHVLRQRRALIDLSSASPDEIWLLIPYSLPPPKYPKR